jgi:hypothetical protein
MSAMSPGGGMDYGYPSFDKRLGPDIAPGLLLCRTPF